LIKWIEYFFIPFKWQDEDAFFTDYAASHKRLSELGFTPPSLGPPMGVAKSSKILTQSAVGVAVAAVVFILSYFYGIHIKIEWTPHSVEFYKMGGAISILQSNISLFKIENCNNKSEPVHITDCNCQNQTKIHLNL
jgi:hypothetical protein